MSPGRLSNSGLRLRRVGAGRRRDAPKRPGARLAAVMALFAFVAGLVAANLTAAYVLTRPPRYASVASVMLDQPQLLVESASEEPTTKLNRLRLKFASLLQTRTFTGPIAERVGIPADDVASELRFSAPGFTLTLSIEARAPTADGSMAIADAAARALVDYLATEQVRIKVPEDRRIVGTVTEAAGSGVRLEPTTTRTALLGGIAGLFVFGGVLIPLRLFGIRRFR